MPLPDRRTKKMLLFVSIANPLWPLLLDKPGDEIEKKDIQILLNKQIKNTLGYQAESKWRHGNEITAAASSKIFTASIQAIEASNLHPEIKEKEISRINIFRTSCRNNDLHLYDSAKILSITKDTTRKIMDEIVYEQRPVFYYMYYETKDKKNSAAKTHELYGGLYHLFLEREKKWFKCPLHVRHVVTIGDGELVRCKLNVPKVHSLKKDELKYWKYDGFLLHRPKKIFWIFEKRDNFDNDFFYFITEKENSEGSMILSGTYLTTGPKPNQDIYNGDVLIKIIERDDKSKIETMMKEDSCIISDLNECDLISDELKQLRQKQARRSHRS